MIAKKSFANDAQQSVQSSQSRISDAQPLQFGLRRIPLLPVSTAQLGELCEFPDPLSVDCKLTVSVCVHLLRTSGLDGVPCKGYESGRSMLRLLLESDAATATFGEVPFEVTGHGIRFRRGNPATEPYVEAHHDQCLAAFAELGLPLSTEFDAGSRRLSLWHLLAESVHGFSLDQDELAWTAVAYAYYIPAAFPEQTAFTWKNGRRVSFSFDDLANELMRRPLGSQSCAGIHGLYALTAILRAHRVSRCLTGGREESVSAFLKKHLHPMFDAQDPVGYWKSRRVGDDVDPSPNATVRDRFDRLLVAGHLLELLLFLPNDLQPPDSYVRRVGMDLYAMACDTLPAERINHICPYSHAVRSLKFLVER